MNRLLLAGFCGVLLSAVSVLACYDMDQNDQNNRGNQFGRPGNNQFGRPDGQGGFGLDNQFRFGRMRRSAKTSDTENSGSKSSKNDNQHNEESINSHEIAGNLEKNFLNPDGHGRKQNQESSKHGTRGQSESESQSSDSGKDKSGMNGDHMDNSMRPNSGNKNKGPDRPKNNGRFGSSNGADDSSGDESRFDIPRRGRGRRSLKNLVKKEEKNSEKKEEIEKVNYDEKMCDSKKESSSEVNKEVKKVTDNHKKSKTTSESNHVEEGKEAPAGDCKTDEKPKPDSGCKNDKSCECMECKQSREAHSGDDHCDKKY